MSESNSFDVLVDEYISQFPSDVQVKLQALRQLIRDTAPNAVEKISYKMPTYAEHGNLVHFAAYSRHIGFYPGSSGIEAFKEELSRYKGSQRVSSISTGSTIARRTGTSDRSVSSAGKCEEGSGKEA